ncbi:MAG: Ni/Fe-hydrogenase, b-type cytochrome subunit [Acidobacteria bacterium]|nr:Ni/Fe-hydrogenase, b-type cytochrome subunit [Acidobacteriota bacterium]
MSITLTSPSYKRIYVWEIPVRLFHWLNAASLIVLMATGYLIGHPATLSHSAEAYQQYWFGNVRFIHFVAGYVFMLNLLIRFYWGLVGNRYARLRTFFPKTKAEIRELWEVLRVDIFEFDRTAHPTVGHNQLASLSYLILFVFSVFQIATGFGLYAAMSDGWVASLFGWVVPVLGGDGATRVWHHGAMWFFVLFTLVHIYIVAYHDYVEGRGTTSSMVGGWKFEREDVLDRKD